MNALEGKKTYIVSVGMVLAGIIALFAPEALPTIDAAQMIGTGVVATMLRMGVAKVGKE